MELGDSVLLPLDVVGPPGLLELFEESLIWELKGLLG